MNRDNDIIFEEALRWHAASPGDAMDWDGFSAWLEADVRHGEAYDAVALGDALIADHREPLRAAFGTAIPANDHEGISHRTSRPRRRMWRWAGAAIAASLVALIALPQLIPTPEQDYATGSASQTIALADGSQLVLAPHSSLTIAGRHQDRMALSGGAWFDIRHDPARVLSIKTGGVEIGDIGTRFDVQGEPDRVRIEVEQGAVSIGSDSLASPVRLIEGHSLFFDAKTGTAVVRPAAAAAIGEWRSGRLSFDAAPLELVAADLSRYAGVKVTVAQGLRDRHFSGTLVIRDGEAALRDLSQLMDLDLRRGPAGFVLDERR